MKQTPIPFLSSLLDGEIAALVQDLGLKLITVQKPDRPASKPRKASSDNAT